MKAPKYNKSEIMKEAHKLYKECRRYGRTFGSCLKQVWASAKAMVRLAEQREAFQKELEARREANRNKAVCFGHYGMESLYANGAYSGD